MKRSLTKTADGSNTLYVESLDEHYHSVHGAMQEALHVFIEHGLRYILSKGKKPNVLEIGFGTGLNCMLTFQNANGVVYKSIEKYPLNIAEALSMGYFDKEELFKHMHDAEWNKSIELGGHSLLKVNDDIKTYDFGVAQHNLIYFDAFGPRVQPDLWTEQVFQKMYDCLEEGGVLVTYCAKGSVKRALKAVGFTIESLPGPPGKREMTRAIK